jgi:iron(III) transport system substrate-binding protein
MRGSPFYARRTTSIAAALVALLAVASCSSGSKTPSSNSEAATTSNAPAAAATTSAAPTSAASSASAPSSSASTAPFTYSETVDQACSDAVSKDGGTLNYVSGTDPEVFKAEAAAFNQKYPNIKVNFTSLRPADAVQRVVTENQAHHALDIDATYSDLPSAQPLFDQKLIANVDWSKLGIASDLEFTLDGIQTFRTEREVLGLGYNTQLVKASDLPNTWQDLINPKWAGKVIVDPRGSYLSGLAVAWGQDKTVSWFQQLMQTDKPNIVKGATASMQKVESGEALLTTSSHDSETAEQQAKGAPVAIKYLDVVPTTDYYAVIMKDAPHPNAAACFLAWWGSPDGQAVMFKNEFKKNLTSPPDLPAGAQLVPINTPDQAKVANATADALANLMK